MNRQQSLFDNPPSQQAVAAHFDVSRGTKARDEGIALTELANQEFVELMRGQARRFCAIRGEVHIDQLRHFALARGVTPKSSNAWGAIFRGKGWKQTGEYRASKLTTNRGHRSPVWRWTPPND